MLFKGWFFKLKNKFEWKATECAPKNYPIEIIYGTLVYHDNPYGSGLYIPSGGIIHRKGWGEMVSSHITGRDFKALPDKLEIKYFSYMEDQFYQGTFELPYERILSLFKEGSKDKENPTYNRIMVGVAPGGAVAVWLTGRYRTTEVFFGQAEPTDGELMAFGVVVPDHEEEVQFVVEESVDSETLRVIRENGIPFNRWSNYRRRYHWEPVFMYGSEPTGGAMTKFVNGELDRLFFPLVEEVKSQTRAAPSFMQFRYRSPEGWAYLYIIHFDETEMVEAFAALGSNQESLQLEFYPHKPIDETQIRLSNKEESIVLQKYFIEDLSRKGQL